MYARQHRGRGFGQAAANNCANNTMPATPSDVNCPWWCIGTFYLGASCTPCTTLCPSGTNWDTTNLVCSPNPQTTNCIGGGAPGPGTTPGNQSPGTPSSCPQYCTLPFTSALDECAPCAANAPANSSTQGLMILAGFLVIGGLLVSLLKK